MADLIGIGLSGLKSHQVALSVTGNNVANTNTAGYSRQEAIFVDNPSLFSGAGYIGQGAAIETIRRLSEDFVIEQVRADTTVYSERSALKVQAESVDNLLASTTTGLTPSLSRFFQAFQGAADDPTSVPQRQLLLTQAEGLVSRFKSLASRLTNQQNEINQELEAAVSSINSLSQSLAELNQSIATAFGSSRGAQPNDLLDQRDEVLRQLAEYVTVSAFAEGADGRVNVFIGKGQPLVIGNSFSRLSAVQSPSDPQLKDIALNIAGNSQIISNNLSGGKLGGLLDFRNHELADAINGLGRIGIVLAETINDQHGLGMDLENNLGGLFFKDVNDQTVARSRVFANSNNLPPVDQVMRVDITNTSALTIDDYEVRFEGPTDNDFNIFRLSDNTVVLKSALRGVFPAKVELDGFRLQFESGTFKTGDRYIVQPTKTGASAIDMVADRVEELALASPIRADSSRGNIGNAVISLGEMLDVNNPLTNQVIPIFATAGQLSPPLGINFISDTRYEIVDLSDRASPTPLDPPMNNQLYRPGLTNPLFNVDPGATMVTSAGADILTVPAPGAGPLLNGLGAQNLAVYTRDTTTGVVSTQAIAIAANSSVATIAGQLQAVSGISTNAYTHVRLSNFVDDGDPTPLGLTINGQLLTVTAPDVFGPDALADLINSNGILQDLQITAVSNGTELELRAATGENIEVVVTGAGDSIDVSTIDPYSPGKVAAATQTVNAGQGVSVAGVIDVALADGITFTADVSSVFEQAPVAHSTYYGFQFEMQGEPKAGDKFTIGYNQGGVSDNRNALALSALETEGLIDQDSVDYGEAYSQIVEKIGTVTNRARLDTESAKALLEQSSNNREAISGVNLDEEAGRLIQFQAAYNASAQVVSIARQLFDTLLNSFR